MNFLKWLKDFFTLGCPHKDDCKYYKECIACDEEPDFCGCYKRWENRPDAHITGASYIGTTKYKER
jgi:hypothetical protein